MRWSTFPVLEASLWQPLEFCPGQGAAHRPPRSKLMQVRWPLGQLLWLIPKLTPYQSQTLLGSILTLACNAYKSAVHLTLACPFQSLPHSALFGWINFSWSYTVMHAAGFVTFLAL